MSRRRYTAPEIADALDATCDWVRGVIHEFNDIGLEALLPAWSWWQAQGDHRRDASPHRDRRLPPPGTR